MPCATIHLRLAGTTWNAWERGNLPRPFGLSEATRFAFLHGSLAPDLGFVPGVERIVSELVHYLRPADMSRALLDGAGNEEEGAFAWGWVTHVLGDVLLHPKVGCAVGEELYSDRSRRVNAIEDVETHVSIEVGLDAQVLSQNRDIPAPPTRPFFDGTSAGFLANALNRVYGLEFSPNSLSSWHKTAVARTRRWPAALRALARAYPLVPGQRTAHVSVRGAAVKLIRSFIQPGSAASGFFRPRPAPGWLVQAVDEETHRFPERLAPLLRDGLHGLENRNLESGEPESDDHPETRRARESVSQRTRLIKAR